MTSLTLDQSLPIVRNLAERKAGAFVHRFRLATDEREDVASQLLLTFISRWPKFDHERASVQTFASRLMDKELTSILRYRLAQGRQPCELPVPDAGPASASIHQFRVDLERAMAPLPEVVRETASALLWFSDVDAAGVVGCSRQMINRRKHQIRNALLAAGITSNYFTSGCAAMSGDSMARTLMARRSGTPQLRSPGPPSESFRRSLGGSNEYADNSRK